MLAAGYDSFDHFKSLRLLDSYALHCGVPPCPNAQNGIQSRIERQGGRSNQGRVKCGSDHMKLDWNIFSSSRNTFHESRLEDEVFHESRFKAAIRIRAAKTALCFGNI